ncbi:MAG: hypothetical protein ACTIDO_17025 [Brevibacterium aurantiacum]|uniref:hypothetical protein n=1 Tax=Brevibacterium aurantiacum TaxID=273384 RepID=UPI003F9273AE
MSKFSEAEARELTDELKADYGALQVKISSAWKGRIWIPLGYESWQEYLDAEFQDVSLRPPKELEEQVIAELRSAGMSTRGIAAATELSKDTVSRRLQGPSVADETVGSPTRIVGLDGKSRPATMPKAGSSPDDEDIVDVEVIDDDDLGDRCVADLGLEPATVNLSPTGNTLGREHVIRAIHDLHFGASSPLTMVKKKSKLLETAFAGGMGDLESLDADEIQDLGRDVADTAAVLSDLLTAIATQRASTFVGTITDADTTGSIGKTIRNLQIIAGDQS